jgi:hypothetical protein
MEKLSLILPAVFLTSAISAVADEKSRSADQCAKAPFPDHWDANAWEAGSGATFWLATTTHPPREKTRKTPTKTNSPTSVLGFLTDTPRSSP